MEKTENRSGLYLKLLKAILWTYIALCFIIAGLNYGVATKAAPEVAHLIHWIWAIYENYVKTIFIIAASFLSLRIIGTSKRTTKRKRNMIGFIVSALVVHIITPLLTGNYDMYFFAMPLPWSSSGLQLLDNASSLHQQIFSSLGQVGIITAIVFFVCACGIVLVGTLAWGRRFQCSSICLFNGFVAETFEPAMPLVGKKRQPKPRTLKTLFVMRWVFLALALFFVSYWVLYLLGVIRASIVETVAQAEVYKYLAGELLVMMFFWVALTGRGYCYYCPLGTVLALISKLAGQKIKTDHTKCVGCNKCNTACPMSIDIKTFAEEGLPVKDLKCVGCGHCVDACPTQNLSYSTRLIEKVTGWSKKAAEQRQ